MLVSPLAAVPRDLAPLLRLVIGVDQPVPSCRVTGRAQGRGEGGDRPSPLWDTGQTGRGPATRYVALRGDGHHPDRAPRLVRGYTGGRMDLSRRIDPATGQPIGRLPKRGRVTRLEPSSAPIEHMAWDWFPLAVAPGKEQLARLLLEQRGLVSFCPLEVRWRNTNRYDKARRAKRQIAYPWHPGVIFIGMREPYPWGTVMSPRPVRHVISMERAQPRAMKATEVGRLIRLKDHGRFMRPDHQRWMETGAEFEAGDAVRVVAGPLEGRQLRVEQISGQMATVFAEFFGAHRGFEIPLEQLARD